MSNWLKNIISIIVVAVVLFFAFRYVASDPSASAVTDHVGVAGAVGGEMATSSDNPADEFAILLSRLKDVDFQRSGSSSVSIFDNPLFRSDLVSFSRDLPQVDYSRPNPFAPVQGNPNIYVHYGRAVQFTSTSSATTTTGGPRSISTSSAATTSAPNTNSIFPGN